MPLDTFIKEVGGNPASFKSQDAKIAWVLSTTDVEKIVWDDGKPGVLQYEHNDGRKKLHIGVRTGCKKRQERLSASGEWGCKFKFKWLSRRKGCFDKLCLTFRVCGLCCIFYVNLCAWQEDEDMRGNSKLCEQTFAQAVDGHRAMLRGVTDIETSRRRAAMHDQPEDVMEVESQAACVDDGMDAKAGMQFGIFDARPGSSSVPDKGLPKAKRTRLSAKPAGSSASNPVPRTPLAESERPKSINPAAANSHRPTESLQVPKLSKKAQDTVKKATDAFAKHKETFADSNIWTNRTRRRILEAAIKSLSGLANQLLALNSDNAESLSREITEWADRAEVRFDALARVRSMTLDYVEADVVPEESLQPLRELGVAMLSNVILFVAGECLKAMDKARSAGD